MRLLSACCVVLLALAACAKTTSPEAGSQTHFLECDRDRDCESLGSAFSCEQGFCRDQSEPPASAGSNASSQAGRGAPEPGPLCDGSDDMRFGYDASGGFIDEIQAFYLRFGYLYFYVQGNCHFIVSRSPTGEVREGDLDSARAERLANDVSFAALPAWQSFHDDESCSDAGQDRLSGPSGSVTCTCGCGDAAPDGMDEAFDTASKALMELWDEGTPMAGPVTAVAFMLNEDYASETTQDWPLASAVEAIVVADPLAINQDSGERLEGADADALRMLRTQALMKDPYISSFPVRDANGNQFGLLVRDELPGDLEAALEAFH